MIVILQTPFRASSHVRRKRTLLHAEFPIEQTLRSEDTETQQLLMQEPWSRERRPEESLFVADYDGLRLLGVSEGALDTAVEPLRYRFGDRLLVDPPSVRYAFGSPTLEPYMSVVVNGPACSLLDVQMDFLERKGRIERLAQSAHFVLEGEAPLASLLGYQRWVRDLAEPEPHVSIRLSRYLPIDDDGPRAA
jgi:hypothetical protein